MKDKELGLIQCSGMFADIINIIAVIVGVQHPGAFTVAFYVTVKVVLIPVRMVGYALYLSNFLPFQIQLKET